jgi:hypothetical protein
MPNGQSKKGALPLRQGFGGQGYAPFFAAPQIVILSNKFYQDLKLLYDLSIASE